MAAEPEILAELRRLRARLPQLTGAVAAGRDGLVLAQDAPGVEPDGLSALTATTLAVAIRMTDATGRGDFRELLIRGSEGYVATYAAGRHAVLTLLTQDRVNVGRLHLEGRRAGARIGELVDAHEAAHGRTTRSKAHDPAGGRTPGKASEEPPDDDGTPDHGTTRDTTAGTTARDTSRALATPHTDSTRPLPTRPVGARTSTDN
ncbi:roadblock/LC7 domain-containing protein [Streptomyces sp. NPDC006186]|jgi:predicted regulator of Ras-like GTPase activity (Roadblock/LC7/MglB family)|uniref:Roadblock/LC7 domain-containing protein n=1 Tax=Streptomyces thermocoprophilus TaxID=78356 RepID=A0ABV5VHU4_9ACTN